MNIHTIIRSYYKQLYTDKFEDPEEMDKLLDTYNLPKLNHTIIKNLNRYLTRIEIGSVIKSLPTQKSPGPDGFTVEFFSVVSRTYPSPLQTTQIERQAMLITSFYKANTSLIPKADRDPTGKENYSSIFLMNTDAKIFNKTLDNRIQQYITQARWDSPLTCRDALRYASQ